jgi:hypothetical protein
VVDHVLLSDDTLEALQKLLEIHAWNPLVNDCLFSADSLLISQG